MSSPKNYTPQDVLLVIAHNIQYIKNCKAYAERLIDWNSVSPSDSWVYFELEREMERTFGLDFCMDHKELVHWLTTNILSIIEHEMKIKNEQTNAAQAIDDGQFMASAIKVILDKFKVKEDPDAVVYNFVTICEMYKLLINAIPVGIRLSAEYSLSPPQKSTIDS